MALTVNKCESFDPLKLPYLPKTVFFDQKCRFCTHQNKSRKADRMVNNYNDYRDGVLDFDLDWELFSELVT